MLIYDDFVCYWSIALSFFLSFNWFCNTIDPTLQFYTASLLLVRVKWHNY